MTTSGLRVTMLAPMRSELRALVKAGNLTKVADGPLPVYRGQVANVTVTATMTLMKMDAARSRAEAVISEGATDHVMVVGVAGGLGTTLAVGEICLPEVVTDYGTNASYRPSHLDGTPGLGKLVTTDGLLIDDESMGPLCDDGYIAVDMETAAVGEACQRLGVPWSAVRGISDRVIDKTLDGNLFAATKDDGSPRLGGVARLVLANPRRVKGLAELGKGLVAGSTAAARKAMDLCAQWEPGT